MSTPLAAVTVTIRSFSPATSSLSPITSNEASGSVVSMFNSTEVVPGARSSESPSATSEPSTWKVAREVSVFCSMLIVIVYS